MIECVFTLDYEIYGNGTGALADLVYEPANRLMDIFRKWDARFVAFIEVAELEKIEEEGTDAAIEAVRLQVRELYNDAFEIGLHLHPQWYNARREGGSWVLDPGEYNLCRLSRERITEIVGRSLEYVRHVLGQRDFTPLSFRAGDWLFQPPGTAAEVLSEHGIKIDSSVFKGGLQHGHALDYRAALKNGYYWPFASNANQPDAGGPSSSSDLLGNGSGLANGGFEAGGVCQQRQFRRAGLDRQSESAARPDAIPLSPQV